jgi:hypothetical protein
LKSYALIADPGKPRSSIKTSYGGLALRKFKAFPAVSGRGNVKAKYKCRYSSKVEMSVHPASTGSAERVLFGET